MNIISRKKEDVLVADLLDPDLICYLDSKTRDDTLDALIDLASASKKLTNKQSFREGIFERESIISTGIGVGVAIPHAKMSDIDEFFLCVGVLSEPVDWDAIDKMPVRLVFLIGGPENRQTQYLQILSQLTYAIKDEDKRKQMIFSNCPADILELFSDSRERSEALGFSAPN